MKIIDLQDSRYPQKLLKISSPPAPIYAEGNIDLLNRPSIAIVGSRKCTEYGIKHAKKFARELALNGFTIVSGLALGIDAIAHDVSKEFDSNTIAVIGSGLNKIYPPENEKLFYEIIKKGGCVISEYEPGAQVDMKNFPNRNRIISGLSMGILVIEANYRSGSTITARYGFKQDKKVFCLPRDIGISNGIGTNTLIKDGALLVTSPNDILDILSEENQLPFPRDVVTENANYENSSNSGICNAKVNNPNFNVQVSKVDFNILDKTEISIPKDLQDVYSCILYTPVHINKILYKSGLDVSKVNQKLIMLELGGFIQNLPGNNYVRI